MQGLIEESVQRFIEKYGPEVKEHAQEICSSVLCQAEELSKKNVLGIGDCNLDYSLADMGFDSISGLELLGKISDELGLDICAENLFNYSKTGNGYTPFNIMEFFLDYKLGVYDN